MRHKIISAFILIASFFGAISVLAGAYASHALTDIAQKKAETAIQYSFIHVVALLIISLYLKNRLDIHGNTDKILYLAGLFWSAGLFLFSINLYISALITDNPLSFLTPFGGTCFSLGWISIIFLRIKSK